MITVINEDILDEKEPVIYVQRYVYPQRTYQVFRKQVSEEFRLSPGAYQRMWCVEAFLFDSHLYTADVSEIFAVIYLDEENPPPVDSTQECNQVEPVFCIVYESDTPLFRCEAVLISHKAVEAVRTATLQEAIDQGLAVLHQILEKQS